MNIFDIIAIVIFALTVLICTFRGFLKIVARLGALFVAFLLSRMFGGELGVKYLGDLIGDAASAVGVCISFILLFLVCRIIFTLLAKLITKVLAARGFDKFLGMLLGIVGGLAGVYLLGFVAEIIILVATRINADATIISTIEGSTILQYFMK